LILVNIGMGGRMHAASTGAGVTIMRRLGSKVTLVAGAAVGTGTAWDTPRARVAMVDLRDESARRLAVRLGALKIQFN
jgi:hypothetical protein